MRTGAAVKVAPVFSCFYDAEKLSLTPKKRKSMNCILTKILQPFKQNRYTWFFAIAIFLSVFCSIWVFYLEIVKAEHDFSSIPNHILKTLLDAAIITTPLFLVKRRGLAFIPVVLLDIFCLCSVWYYRNYLDIIPLSSFLMIGNFNGVFVQSTLSSMRWVDLWFVIPTLVTGVVYKLRWQKRICEERKSMKRVWWPFISSLALYLMLHFILSIRDMKSGHYTSLVTRFTMAPNNVSYFDCNGMWGYLLYQTILLVPIDESLSSEERAEVDRFLGKTQPYTDALIPENQGKNMVLILVESLNSWVIGEKVNGMEITPNLNRLVNDSTSIVALHVLPQAKDGRSSDGQFIINTGLLPLQNGAVIEKYDDRAFYSLPKVLEQNGYNTTCITIDRATYWNQNGACETYGYHRLIDRYPGEDMARETTCDRILLERLVHNMKSDKQPCFYQVITGDSHIPYLEPDQPTVLSQATEFPQQVRNYMETFHLVDRNIGYFIEMLKSSGLYENTVVVIASDHNQLLEPCDVLGYNDTEVAFIVANAGIKHVQDSVMGQIDIYPTLLDVMGCNDYSWKGLGNSILRSRVESAVGWNGEVEGNVSDSLSQRRREAWKYSRMIITGDYFAQPER